MLGEGDNDEMVEGRHRAEGNNLRGFVSESGSSKLEMEIRGTELEI